METERTGTIIVAAGMSRRMEGRDKLFEEIDGKPLLGRLLDRFEACDLVDEIVIVTNETNLERCHRLAKECSWTKVSQICAGGLRRQDSVRKGLQSLSKCQWVIIHDGARPLVDGEIITQGLMEAKEYGAAVAAVPVKDTIKIATPEGFVRETPERDDLWAVQTPQVFRYDLIRQAHEEIFEDVSDDATMVEKLGHPVKLYMSSYHNIKVTTPEDLSLVKVLLGNS